MGKEFTYKLSSFRGTTPREAMEAWPRDSAPALLADQVTFVRITSKNEDSKLDGAYGSFDMES
jgi:hypothetical protein